MNCFKSENWKRQLLLFLLLNAIPWSAAYAYNVAATLKTNAEAIIYFMVAFSYVIGIWFIISAVLELKKYGQSRSMMPMNIDIMGPLARLIIGAALLFLPETLGVLANSLWGNQTIADSILPITTGGTDQFGAYQETAKYLIRALGFISLVRGLIMLNRITHQGSQPGTAGKAAAHIVGGVFAINIEATYTILKNSILGP